MYYVYILTSDTSSHFDTGFTGNIEERINAHNAGKVSWSSRHRLWRIAYQEAYASKPNAIKREKFLKSHAGRNWLKKLFKID